MHVTTLFETFAEYPLLLLAVLLVLGAAVGHVRIAGVRLGPAAVLFAALGVSAWAAAAGVDLEIPEVVGTFGLVLFTYTIGVVSGTHFFASLRRGWPTMLVVAGALALVGAVAVVIGRALSLEPGTVAGAYAGALTNTPALAAASARAADPAAPTIGYSITYLGGVIVMLVVAAWSLRRPGAQPRREEIGHITVRVEVDEPMTVSMLASAHHDEIGVSRLKHAHAANPTIVPAGTETIGHNDLVTIVGPRAALDDVAERLGHVSSHDIVEDRHDLDFRRDHPLEQAAGRPHRRRARSSTRSSAPPSAGCAAATSTSSRTTPSCSRWATGCGSSHRAPRWPRSASTSATATAACPTSTSAASPSASRSAWPSA